MRNELPAIERQTRLAECETIIERGLQTFIEVGQALAEIRDERHYLDEFDTFESYCKTRWNFTPSRASRLITASEVTTALPMGNTPIPTSERQARELAGLDPEAAGDVMRRADAATEGKITAAAILAARAEIEGTAGTPPGLNLMSEQHVPNPIRLVDLETLMALKRNNTEWITAWAAWQLRQDGHSFAEVAAMGRAECHGPGGYEATSWPHLKGHLYASWFIQSQDGGTLMVQGLTDAALVYTYESEWQRALDGGHVDMDAAGIWVPAERFSDDFAQARIDAADQLDVSGVPA